MQVDNRTSFETAALALSDRDGREGILLVAKATFTVAPRGQLTLEDEDRDPIREVDEHVGDEGSTALLWESDLCHDKPGADFAVVGDIVLEGAMTQALGSVGIADRGIDMLLLGDRVWESSLTGLRPSPPLPIERIGLSLASAYGGTQGDKGFEANPFGRGFAVSQKFAEGRALPNLESPHKPIRSWKDRPQPTSPALRNRSLPHRARFAGTYDQAWKDTRAPYLPADFDARFFMAGPPELALDRALTGCETISIELPCWRARIEVPELTCRFGVVHEGRAHALEARWDTLVVDVSRRRLVVTGRTFFAAHRTLLRIARIDARS